MHCDVIGVVVDATLGTQKCSGSLREGEWCFAASPLTAGKVWFCCQIGGMGCFAG